MRGNKSLAKHLTRDSVSFENCQQCFFFLSSVVLIFERKEKALNSKHLTSDTQLFCNLLIFVFFCLERWKLSWEKGIYIFSIFVILIWNFNHWGREKKLAKISYDEMCVIHIHTLRYSAAIWKRMTYKYLHSDRNGGNKLNKLN